MHSSTMTYTLERADEVAGVRTSVAGECGWNEAGAGLWG